MWHEDGCIMRSVNAATSHQSFSQIAFKINTSAHINYDSIPEIGKERTRKSAFTHATNNQLCSYFGKTGPYTNKRCTYVSACELVFYNDMQKKHRWKPQRKIISAKKIARNPRLPLYQDYNAKKLHEYAKAETNKSKQRKLLVCQKGNTCSPLIAHIWVLRLPPPSYLFVAATRNIQTRQVVMHPLAKFQWIMTRLSGSFFLTRIGC